jgi:hypothetical protein
MRGRLADAVCSAENVAVYRRPVAIRKNSFQTFSVDAERFWLALLLHHGSRGLGLLPTQDLQRQACLDHSRDVRRRLRHDALLLPSSQTAVDRQTYCLTLLRRAGEMKSGGFRVLVSPSVCLAVSEDKDRIDLTSHAISHALDVSFSRWWRRRTRSAAAAVMLSRQEGCAAGDSDGGL